MVRDFTFFLGAHPSWLWSGGAQGPVLVSAPRVLRSSLQPATVPFILDSGGVSHLLQEGRWAWSSQTHAELAHRAKLETGKLKWALVQDWPCLPAVLEKTGKSVLEHQELTLSSYLKLRESAPRIPWMPVLQGQSKEDFLKHVASYRDAGVELEALERVAVGSLAPRQSSDDVADILETLSSRGIALHGLGVKLEGVKRLMPFLRSSDGWAPHGVQPDAEAYRRSVGEAVRELREYADYEGILGFFG